MSVTSSDLTHTLLRAEGFSCPSCVTKIEKRVGRLTGVESVTVRFATAKIEVEHDPEVTSVEEIIAGVKKAGYTARESAI